MTNETKRTWAEIHLDRLAGNYHALRALAPRSRFAGLVKANAYGHGAVAVGRKLEELGADYLLVACLDEAIQLREAGLTRPILILGYTPIAYTAELLRYDLTQAVYDVALAKEHSAAALAAGGRLNCFIQCDTGMGRLGLLCQEDTIDRAAAEVEEICSLPGLEPVGLMQHFSDADTCPAYSRLQIDRYNALLAKLAAMGRTFPIRTCCAGAATLNYPEVHYDMVRPGILLFGYSPDHACDGMVNVRPVMELKSRIASVKAMPAGSCISYGRTYTLERDSLVAVVPVGYGDGLFRLLSSRQEFLLHGQRVRQIGRVCMDMCMIDVTDLPEVTVGDEVTVFGEELPLTEKSDAVGTISYEMLCDIAPRVPRVYVE
ncbi:MAG: alanine racemase [Clostridiales bacterium]|nr:alanine racemase [Clostridiales bacterium]